jgi:hypothetical protein
MHAIRRVISQIICAWNWFPDPWYERKELQPRLRIEKFGMFKPISIQKIPYLRGNTKFNQKIIIYFSKTCWNFQKIFFQKEMKFWRKMIQHPLEYLENIFFLSKSKSSKLSNYWAKSYTNMLFDYGITRVILSGFEWSHICIYGPMPNHTFGVFVLNLALLQDHWGGGLQHVHKKSDCIRLPICCTFISLYLRFRDFKTGTNLGCLFG